MAQLTDKHRSQILKCIQLYKCLRQTKKDKYNHENSIDVWNVKNDFEDHACVLHLDSNKLKQRLKNKILSISLK